MKKEVLAVQLVFCLLNSCAQAPAEAEIQYVSSACLIPKEIETRYK